MWSLSSPLNSSALFSSAGTTHSVASTKICSRKIYIYFCDGGGGGTAACKKAGWIEDDSRTVSWFMKCTATIFVLIICSL